MFEKIKFKIFPCQQRLKILIHDREIACRENSKAHEELSAVCEKKHFTFPPLQENKIVNPSKINPNSNF